MNTKFFLLISSVAFLSACGVNVGTSETKEWVYPVNNPYDDDNTGFYDASQSKAQAQALPKFVKTAETPQVQESAKSMDVAWVQKQNPDSYTIILASGDKPLAISQALMEAPKTEHAAALKYEQRGHVYYTGIYGSYDDNLNAQNQLSNLPENLQSSAKIVQWKNIQGLNYL
jgi:septal ring-binding cell division protein DamX